MVTFKKIIRFFQRNYWIFLFLIIVISFGQILSMLPWQDDNAIFFKLAHIQEPAGFLGKGVIGEGAYKYTAFFYYPIYLAFGYQPVYYFALCFIMYGLSTFFVYKVVSKMFNENSGMLAGFLYACGFIGSDSYIRLYNSVITSLSVILICIFISCYWNFFKSKKIKWYLYSVFVFFLAAEFARARTHYLFAIPIIFEIVMMAFKKPILRQLSFSLLRTIPFIYIFYQYVITADFRSKEAGNFIVSLIKGDFYKLFGFLTSFANLVTPQWIIDIITSVSSTQFSNISLYYLAIAIVIILILYKIYISYRQSRIYIILFVLFSIIWKYVSSLIFLSPSLVASPSQIYLAYIGGELLYLAIVGFFLIGNKYKSLYFILFSGIVINLLSYNAYNPTQIYEKINRYLSHSFLYLVIFGSYLFYISKVKYRKLVLLILVFWGLNNLAEGVFYQRNIILNRTNPVKIFYQDFQKLVATINKGDVIYFDVADDSRGNFADAFSVAQMPNSTALAWRYNVDRYDFQMFEEPNDLIKYLDENRISEKNIHTFFYSKKGLIETTDKFKELSKGQGLFKFDIGNLSSEINFAENFTGTWINKTNIEITKDIKIPSIVPTKLKVSLKAEPLDLNNLAFPVHYGYEKADDIFINNSDLNNMAFKYRQFKESFKSNKIEVSSIWQGRLGSNLIDGDEDSTWQADRLLWLESEQYVILKLNKADTFDRLTFVNAYSNSTPLEFEMFFSNDMTNWKNLGIYKNTKRLENAENEVVNFKPTKFKYLKIIFTKTLSGDSPVISEIFIIPAEFNQLDVKKVNKYLSNPFAYISDLRQYGELLSKTGLTGRLDISWGNEKKFNWQNNSLIYSDILLDGKVHTYEFLIPAGGTEIDKLKFELNNFPGMITITEIKAESKPSWQLQN